ncbi:MAG: hypothetical protein ACE145_20615 [Terriglobia bacterium]
MRLGSVRTRAILVQVVIVAGVIAWYKIFWPGIQKERAAAERARRDAKIAAFVESAVVEAAGRENDAPSSSGQAGARPQRLRLTPSADEAQAALGAPDTSMTDFAGALHLTWIGNTNSLELAFDKGRLYALTLTERKSGRGWTAYENPAMFRAF